MTFLSPLAAAIAAAVTIPALVALYLLKRRRRVQTVSSTLLWRKAIEDLQVNAPFQRLRRNLLLLLQLIALLLLLTAFARPATRHAAEAGGRTVILIDHSGSMNATDVSPTRLDEAKRLARTLIEDLESGGAMLISFAAEAQVLEPFTTDRARLRNAIDAIGPTDQPTRIGQALQLIEPFAGDTSQPPIVVYVLSDGRVRQSPDLTLGGAELRFVSIGRSGPADNVGFAAVSARRDLESPQHVRLFTRLVNYGPGVVDTSVILRIDGQVQRVADVTLGAAGDQPAGQSLEFDLNAAGAAFVQLTHDHADLLEADNRVQLHVPAPRQLRVVLVSPGNALLSRAIRAAGVGSLTTVEPDAFDPADLPEADVMVFDRFSPKTEPAIDSLYFAAVPPIEGLAIRQPQGDEDRPYQVLDWRKDHPLLRYVALGEVVLGKAVSLSLPPAARALAAGETGPILAMIDSPRRRRVVVGFDVLASNWPMKISFPVFVSNALSWLALGGSGGEQVSYEPGQVAVIPTESGVNEVAYDGPDSLRSKTEAGRAVMPAFERAGLYTARRGVPAPYDRLPVNLVDSRESDLAPADRLAVGTQTTAAMSQSGAAIRREIWRWFVWIAVAVLMIEWVVYVRRMHL